MKQTLKISIFAVMLLCSTMIYAQEVRYLTVPAGQYDENKTTREVSNYGDDETSREVLKKINEALVAGDCDKAQRSYNVWKKITEKHNTDIEWEIKDCQRKQSTATVKTATEALYADGMTISLNGKELSDSQIRTLFANSKSYKLYDSGMRLIPRDNSLWYGMGGGAIALGAVFQLGWINTNPGGPDGDELYGLARVGLGIAGGGLGLIAVGFSRNLLGKAKIRKAVDLYNNGKMYSSVPATLNFGLTQNGIGLAINF